MTLTTSLLESMGRRPHLRGVHQPSRDGFLLASAVYGSALLTAPAPILRALSRRRAADRRALLAARALGARHLAQAVTLMQHPSPGWMLVGAGIDATHAATMLALAIARPNRQTLATISATLALLIAAAEVHESRRSRNRPSVQSGMQANRAL